MSRPDEFGGSRRSTMAKKNSFSAAVRLDGSVVFNPMAAESSEDNIFHIVEMKQGDSNNNIAKESEPEDANGQEQQNGVEENHSHVSTQRNVTSEWQKHAKEISQPNHFASSSSSTTAHPNGTQTPDRDGHHHHNNNNMHPSNQKTFFTRLENGKFLETYTLQEKQKFEEKWAKLARKEKEGLDKLDDQKLGILDRFYNKEAENIAHEFTMQLERLAGNKDAEDIAQKFALKRERLASERKTELLKIVEERKKRHRDFFKKQKEELIDFSGEVVSYQEMTQSVAAAAATLDQKEPPSNGSTTAPSSGHPIPPDEEPSNLTTTANPAAKSEASAAESKDFQSFQFESFQFESIEFESAEFQSGSSFFDQNDPLVESERTQRAGNRTKQKFTPELYDIPTDDDDDDDERDKDSSEKDWDDSEASDDSMKISSISARVHSDPPQRGRSMGGSFCSLPSIPELGRTTSLRGSSTDLTLDSKIAGKFLEFDHNNNIRDSARSDRSVGQNSTANVTIDSRLTAGSMMYRHTREVQSFYQPTTNLSERGTQKMLEKERDMKAMMDLCSMPEPHKFKSKKQKEKEKRRLRRQESKRRASKARRYAEREKHQPLSDSFPVLTENKEVFIRCLDRVGGKRTEMEITTEDEDLVATLSYTELTPYDKSKKMVSGRRVLRDADGKQCALIFHTQNSKGQSIFRICGPVPMNRYHKSLDGYFVWAEVKNIGQIGPQFRMKIIGDADPQGQSVCVKTKKTGSWLLRCHGSKTKGLSLYHKKEDGSELGDCGRMSYFNECLGLRVSTEMDFGLMLCFGLVVDEMIENRFR